MKIYLITLSLSLLIILTACTGNKRADKKKNKVVNMNVEYIEGTTAQLGEGSIWDYKNSVLYWIDIEGMKLHKFNPEKDTNTSYELGKRVGTVVPETNNSVIVALKDGLYRRYFSSDSLEFIARPTSLKEEERFNDGKCDPAGRLWVGTMRIQGRVGDSYLYKYEPATGFSEMIDSVSISNGIVWSPDHSRMYYIDTPTGKVMKYDFDNISGHISNPEIAVYIEDSLGHPDGMTIDEEGKLWIGMWGGGAVCRFDPVSGHLLNKIEVPAFNVTSCAFGGENLDVLYITTASTGMNDVQKEMYPNAGGLFRVKPGVKGLKAFYFKTE